MNEQIIKSNINIESRIFTIRGMQVMLDFHLAELYSTETKRINEQVKRNSRRFPENFMFQLSKLEFDSLNSLNLKSQIATSSWGGKRKLPYAFTEQGVAMLSAVLHSDTAINVSIQIMNAFVQMRHILQENSLINQRLEKIEYKIIESDNKFEQIFKALESKNSLPTQGVFFDGQVFDAYELASRFIRSAKNKIILIDNYIDENTLIHLAKKEKSVNALILCKNITPQLKLDIEKANSQYGNFELKIFGRSHDRFLIIDDEVVYHLGASLKDLGKKWFAFSKLEKSSVESILNQIDLS